MANFFFFAALAAMAGVFISLLLGIVAMTKTESKDRLTSNKMMRSRVILQALAILFLVLAYWAK